MLVDTIPSCKVPPVQLSEVSKTNQKTDHSTQPQEAAKDMKTLRKLTYQLVEAEERGVHIRNLLANGVHLREEEEFW